MPRIIRHPLQLTLERLAPALYAAAEHGKQAQAQLAKTGWAGTYFTTTAVASSIGGYARWRVCAEHLVTHDRLLPQGVVVDSSLSEHRSGQYRLKGEGLSFALTVKHKHHKQGDEPYRMIELLEQAPVGSSAWIVTLQVNAPGGGPTCVVIRARDSDKIEETFTLDELLAAPAVDIDQPMTDDVEIQALNDEDTRALPEPEVVSEQDLGEGVDGEKERRHDEGLDADDAK